MEEEEIFLSAQFCVVEARCGHPCPALKIQNLKLPMPTAPFEKTNIPWQIKQLGQRLGEWAELKLREIRFPNFNGPDWRWLDFAIAPRVWEVLFWLIVITFITWLVIKLYPLLQPFWVTWQAEGETATRRPAQPVRDRPVAVWLQQAQKLQQQGNYPEACRALYLAMLQHLNDAKIAPHEPSRTDGEYRHLVKELSYPRAYGTLLAAHEQLCFGGVELNSEDFNRCQRAYREIEGVGIRE
jgi:Domain of unknown function (DUF4129)